MENRSWATSYRGKILIHASKSAGSLAALEAALAEIPEFNPDEALSFGAIVGVAELWDCMPFESSPPRRFAEGPYCWLLRNARAIEPIAFKGALGLFSVPDEVVKRALTRA